MPLLNTDPHGHAFTMATRFFPSCGSTYGCVLFWHKSVSFVCTVQCVHVCKLQLSVSLCMSTSFLTMLTYTKLKEPRESNPRHKRGDKHIFWMPVCEKHSFHHKVIQGQTTARENTTTNWKREDVEIEDRLRKRLTKGVEEMRDETPSTNIIWKLRDGGMQESGEQLERDKKHCKTTSYYSN